MCLPARLWTREQLADARKLASLCHRYGIRVGVYIGSTVGYETLLLEQPEAVDWFIPDYLDRPSNVEFVWTKPTADRGSKQLVRREWIVK